MRNLSTSAQPVNQKVYPAIELTGRWVSPDPKGLLLAGMSAGLTITVAGKEEEWYFLTPNVYRGECLGWRITKVLDQGEFGEGYDIPVDLFTCSCLDFLTRVREDGRCKHLTVCQRALGVLGLWHKQNEEEAGAA